MRSNCLSDSDDMKSSLSVAIYWLDLSVWWEFGIFISSRRIPLALEVLVPFTSFPAATAFLTLLTWFMQWNISTNMKLNQQRKGCRQIMMCKVLNRFHNSTRSSKNIKGLNSIYIFSRTSNWQLNTCVRAVLVHLLRFSSSTSVIPYQEGSLAATEIVFSNSTTFLSES